MKEELMEKKEMEVEKEKERTDKYKEISIFYFIL